MIWTPHKYSQISSFLDKLAILIYEFCEYLHFIMLLLVKVIAFFYNSEINIELLILLNMIYLSQAMH